MRVLRTTAELHAKGLTRENIRSGERRGRWRRIIHGVYGAGSDPPTPVDVARATAYVTAGVTVDALAGVLHDFDAVHLDGRVNVVVAASANGGRRRVRRVRELPRHTVEVHQVRCADGTTTMWQLAERLDDAAWEQALESALRKKLVTPVDLAEMAARPERRAARVRRVIRARGGLDVVPTESLLETLMVQLARDVPGLPPPERQVNIYNEHGILVARVDLAWPSLGIFLELDGQQHRNQPLYDAARQTAVSCATGWLVGRFTWHEVTRTPAVCRRRLAELLAQATRRPLVAN